MATEADAAGEAPGPLRRSVKAVGRGFLWPARRFVDPRVDGMLAHVDARNEDLYARMAALVAAVESGLNARLEAVAEQARAAHETNVRTLQELELLRDRLQLPDDVVELRGDLAHFLNFAFGHRGFAAQEGLWFNAPVEVEHKPGAVETKQVSERIAEVPYVFRALAGLPSGARILDVGAAESTVALSLASLGYEVIALDPRPYPLSHPRLRSVQALVEEWEADEPFDAVICLSTIEHVGLAAYGQEQHEQADLAAMRRLHELTKPGGRLVLTVPFGEYSVDSFERTYDREHLDELLHGWTVSDFRVLRRTERQRWEILEDGAESETGSELVALVTAERPD
jgi:2-polyprenyl-3-methyl-5-hydroxy-6-metoxy-1,4-benzoquinol methylase